MKPQDTHRPSSQLQRRLRPLLQHVRPLPDSQSDSLPMLDRRREDLARLVEIVAGVQHVVDLGAVLGPFLDLIEIAVVRDQWLVSLVVGPFADCAPAAWNQHIIVVLRSISPRAMPSRFMQL